MLTRFTTWIRYFWMGLMIGICDLVPGVSGGTLAFSFGIWEDILESINLAIRTVKNVVTLNFKEAKNTFLLVRWVLVVPIGAGILSALIVGASILNSLFAEYESFSRAVFLGIVIGALPVPLRLSTGWRPVHFFVCTIGLMVTFLLAGLPSRELESPPLILIFLVSLIAICATLLPGLSGSFLLLVFGFYELFIRAIAERNFEIWICFIAGAWTGVVLFNGVIKWLLANHRTFVLALLIGFMLGGLRVLWPWLGSERELLVPDRSGFFIVIVCFCLGLVVSLLGGRFARVSIKG